MYPLFFSHAHACLILRILSRSGFTSSRIFSWFTCFILIRQASTAKNEQSHSLHWSRMLFFVNIPSQNIFIIRKSMGKWFSFGSSVLIHMSEYIFIAKLICYGYMTKLYTFLTPKYQSSLRRKHSWFIFYSWPSFTKRNSCFPSVYSRSSKSSYLPSSFLSVETGSVYTLYAISSIKVYCFSDVFLTKIWMIHICNYMDFSIM